MLLREFREGDEVITPAGRQAVLLERQRGDKRGIVRWTLRYHDDGSEGICIDTSLKPSTRRRNRPLLDPAVARAELEALFARARQEPL